MTEGNALDPLFDANGYSRVAGTAALLPTGPTTPEVVRELAAAGVRAVLVDGPIPAGSLGVDEPVEVPIVGVPSATAAQVRAALAAGVPGRALRRRGRVRRRTRELRAVAPFSSTGLALDGGARPELAAPGVGLVTSVPGRSEGGAARYGTISGSSAAAAVVAGAAALLADARPDLDAGGLRGALAATARRAGGAGTGNLDLEAASAVELVADPPVAALGALDAAGTPATGTITLRNVSRRALVVRLRRGSATTGVTVTTTRDRVVLPPGESRTVSITVEAAVRPAAPGALTGAVRASVQRGPRLRIPWSVAVPVTRLPVVSRVRLSVASFRASDTHPAVLALVAGRVDGTRERPQLLPLELLDVELYRRARRVGPPCAAPGRAAGPLRVRSHGPRPGGGAPAPRRVHRPDRRHAGGRRPADERRPLLSPAVAALQSASSCERRETPDERDRDADPSPREPVRARPRAARTRGGDVRRRPEPRPRPR